MKAGQLAMVALLAACATPPPAYRGPTYTRATLAGRSTAELAATFLPGVVPADIESHEIGDPIWSGGSLVHILFRGRPHLLADDICGRDTYIVAFYPLAPDTEATRSRDMPARPDRPYHRIRIAVAANCALPPGERYFALVGTRFAGQGIPLTLEEGITILRQLVAARAAAAGSGPLPFRLRCSTEGDGLNRASYFCPPDVRALLAGLGVERAITIDRAPFATQILCGAARPETGDSIEVTDAGDHPQWVWEVRLHDMGTDRAEIVLTQQEARHVMRC
jgi:hypothetical protein